MDGGAWQATVHGVTRIGHDLATKPPPLFTLASPQKKYLGIYLTKYVQDLYDEKYKTLMNKIKELNKWREILCPCTERLDIVRMLVFPNLICRFNAISIKVPASIL